MLSVKDAQELLELQARLMQPLADKASAYSRQLFEIASDTGAEFAKTAEDQSAEARQKFMAVASRTWHATVRPAPNRWSARCAAPSTPHRAPWGRCKGGQAGDRDGRPPTMVQDASRPSRRAAKR